jgi:type II secretory pathway pseudopilin PulG
MPVLPGIHAIKHAQRKEKEKKQAERAEKRALQQLQARLERHLPSANFHLQFGDRATVSVSPLLYSPHNSPPSPQSEIVKLKRSTRVVLPEIPVTATGTCARVTEGGYRMHSIVTRTRSESP